MTKRSWVALVLQSDIPQPRCKIWVERFNRALMADLNEPIIKHTSQEMTPTTLIVSGGRQEVGLIILMNPDFTYSALHVGCRSAHGKQAAILLSAQTFLSAENAVWSGIMRRGTEITNKR